MAESYLALSRDDRLDVLGVAATKSGRPVHLLEKDVMVVWAVEGLFGSRIGEHLVFKGGTSLSKGYGIIKRFSEDIDVTYDVRQIIPDLAKGDAPLPATNAEANRWRDAIDKNLPVWVKETALPILQKHADTSNIKVTPTAEGGNLFVDYDHVASGYGYVPPRVKLEFGARSTGEPAEVKEIKCDALGQVDGVTFPSAKPRLMLPKRTFWEKATAVHVFCKKELKEEEHISRHWHDLVRLDDAGYVKAALNDRQLANDVAAFKSKFFRTTDRKGQQIDYPAAVNGNLQLIPGRDERKLLEADYKKMADNGILLGDVEPFEKLMDRCTDLGKRANEHKG
jgi:hypothetical protein